MAERRRLTVSISAELYMKIVERYGIRFLLSLDCSLRPAGVPEDRVDDDDFLLSLDCSLEVHDGGDRHLYDPELLHVVVERGELV